MWFLKFKIIIDGGTSTEWQKSYNWGINKWVGRFSCYKYKMIGNYKR